MAELSTEALSRALAQTLEEAAFVFAEPSTTPPPMPAEVIQARLAYSGPHDGELLLACDPSLAGTVAANLLGEEEGGATVVGDDEDAIGELLNMVAGGLVVALFGPDVPCRLGLPRVDRIPASAYARALQGAYASATLLEEEGRRIDLSARITRGAGA